VAVREPRLNEVDEVGRRRRRSKNIAVGVALLGLVVLFYLITIVKIGSTLP
jgi:hypothetical protein